MILFEEDWEQYPGAIIDTKTTNESWVRMASVYTSMGISNRFFHLALLQPQLQGVDPYSPDLTMDQKTAIALEIKLNPWYFFREVVRIPNGNSPLRFGANRANLSILWCFFVGIDYALIMPRQVGKSTVCDGLELWLKDYHYKRTTMLLLTRKDDLRAKNVERIKQMQKQLPRWLNLNTKKDADNTETVTSVVNENRIIFYVGQAQEFLARSVGRGETSPYFHSDEGAFTPNVQYSIPAAAAATATARENYQDAGMLYGNIYTTTAGKLDTKEGKYMYDFIHSGMFWNEVILDSKNKSVAEQTVVQASPDGRCLMHGTFSHRQVGKTDEWLRKRIALAKATKDEIDRDYFNKWTSGTDCSIIPTHILEIIRASEIDPLYTYLSLERYMLNWYIPSGDINSTLAKGHYIMGLDSSEAVGRDANAITLTSIRDLSVIATSGVYEANLHKYGLWLARFLIAYPNITLVIENKSSARGIIDTIVAEMLKAGINPFARIYNRIVDHQGTNKDLFDELVNVSRTPYRLEAFYLKHKSAFGYNATGGSRKFLYDIVLQDAVKSTGHLVKDKSLSSEIKGLIIKNNRVDHQAGGHDDRVISWLICHWFAKHSTNLQFYGINLFDCLALVTPDGAELSPDEIISRQKIGLINKEIEVIKTNLASASTFLDIRREEMLLAHKIKEAKQYGDTTLNLDAILNSVREHKSNQRDVKAQARENNLRKFGIR